MHDTQVTFPAGAVEGVGRIEAVLPVGDGSGGTVAVGDDALAVHADTALLGVVLDRTPFHPVDHAWPDQPADDGTVAGIPVVSCVTATADPDDQVTADGAIRVRRGTEGHRWLVLHLLPEAQARTLGEGQEVEAVVDAARRQRLSRGHSACHLAALALNRVAASFWDSDPGRSDSLGSPDLDSVAITLSRIVPDGALDVYRLGKSTRRKGLRTADLLADLPRLQVEANAVLAEWTAAGGASTVDTGGDESLSARRMWRAELPEGTAEIPCGGTHVSDIGELAGMSVTYQPTDGGFQVVTRCLAD
ncbi:MAG: hypothetical protein U0R64_01145 [Candidatus Nanopelagicales bacterium]